MVVFDGCAGFITSEMSVGLSESQNYIWNPLCDADCLGEGAFGKVFLGAHKKTGDKVAVKTYKHVNPQLSQETNMLQTLKHQYIIQLLAIEVEEYSKNKVMIMELCNGGSLMSFLNEPENACGLQDEEFLLVLEHLSVGLEYLKRHNVIHRDVKPDNIMRHLLDDDRTIYKLADFGTARELPEGQNYSSLYGTEPYLNPQLFKVCFFRDADSTREFGANTELWSIGVTLYQTATGNLPFMVQDRHVLLAIYNEMKRNEGIISGRQQKNSDNVIYEKKLPQTSRLSFGLRHLITPIISGLFLQEVEKHWSFTQYYEQVVKLRSRKVISVFYVNKMQLLNIYVKPDETFHDFKCYIIEQTDVSEDNQVFLYKQNLIVNCFEDFQSIGSECIFLFDRSSPHVEPTSNTQLFFENLSNFQTNFMSAHDSPDLRLAFDTCKDLCVFKNLMNYQSAVHEFFTIFIKDFDKYCKEKQKELRKIYDILLEKYTSTNSRANILEKLKDMNQSQQIVFIEEFKTVTNTFVGQSSKLFDTLASAKTETVSNKSYDSYLRIVGKELADMKRLTKNLYIARVNKKLFDYEKIKILHCVRTIMETFTDKMDPCFEGFVNEMKHWYQSHFFPQVRALSALDKKINNYRCDLKKYEQEIHSQSDETLKKIVLAQSSTFNKPKLLGILEKHKENNLDMKFLIEENLNLIKAMSELILSVETDFSTDF